MATMIRSADGIPRTVPLEPAAIVGRKAVIYANLDPDTVLGLLGGADAIGGAFLLEYVPDAQVAANVGCCRVLYAANLLVDELPDLSEISSAVLAGMRNSHWTVQCGPGEADQEYVLIKTAADTYAFAAVTLTPIS